ncbi:hypothetical protein P4K96_26480 [Bacillus cereus]|nr:hypothetical protein [Bacillus cereus]
MASIIEGTLNVSVDFTPASLQRIEKAINCVYLLGHEPLFSTIVSYGLYLGEVFVRNNSGAVWGPYKEDLMELEFRIDRGMHSYIGYPLKRVQKYWFDRTCSLSTYFQMNIDLLEGKLKPDLGLEWKNYNEKYEYRFLRVEIETSNDES